MVSFPQINLDPLRRLWDSGTAPVSQALLKHLTVDEGEIRAILAEARAQLPTTEALLLGKPQAGKSSLIRGLTGVSAEIIGQGFRPHTQHTQRYAYPSADLPLLIFTDTVGLGDIGKPTAELLTELTQDLDPDPETGVKAQILVLVVKITDFATGSLREIARQLKSQYPHLPCLLAVTCLHEVYPRLETEHPPYPPEFPDLLRAFEQIKTDFAPHWDEAVLLDFTLEEDGFNPVFYGLEALGEKLTALLPEAEARAIHQLLEGETEKRLGGLYRDVARRYILAFSIAAATLAAAPLPFATMPVLTALQVSLVGLLGQLYGQTLSPSQAGGVVSAIAGGFLAQAVGRELVKFVPGFGSALAASWAAAYTWSLGEGACVYFGDLMGGKKPDLKKIRAAMEQSWRRNHSAEGLEKSG
ncbi:MAG: DUF697 domain-containing protein [Cyanobacteria bacterium RI_101]|nr:DUF697 domain-containing protein [Cyanobacteria bacterium RI_101]